ncbi:uncharacterized protein PG998_011550 [Apiospora kogelbergensis]|uniref:Uncharacterized protein n=1 Tax=Apiospora kogelbergensis TaxID=1337665 RepID=A0AAW0RBA4_9PEZI
MLVRTPRAALPRPSLRLHGHGVRQSRGQIWLGHFIAWTKQLDQVVDTGDVKPLPTDLCFWTTETAKLPVSRQGIGRANDHGLGDRGVTV